jgi:hypothetical protein
MRSQTNDAERGASEQRPARASDTTSICSAPVEPLLRYTAPLSEDITKLRQLSEYASNAHGVRATATKSICSHYLGHLC